MNQAWTVFGIPATLGGLLWRSITQPWGPIERGLGLESTAMRKSVERLAVDFIRHTPGIGDSDFGQIE